MPQRENGLSYIYYYYRDVNNCSYIRQGGAKCSASMSVEELQLLGSQQREKKVPVRFVLFCDYNICTCTFQFNRSYVFILFIHHPYYIVVAIVCVYASTLF